VVAILRALVRLGIEPSSILLAAPTGKAAYRMAESIRGHLGGIESPEGPDRSLSEGCPDALTLHRLLGYSPRADRFAHHENAPLAGEVVVVDESSMVDLFLMERLVAALPPNGRLVLLGDADQLPSVDAGAVLRDLAPAARERGSAAEVFPEGSSPEWAVRLAHSYRMDAGDPSGRKILSFATHVNAGEAEALSNPGVVVRCAAASDLSFDAVEWLDPRDGLAAFLSVYEERFLASFAGHSRTYRIDPNDGSLLPGDVEDLDRLFSHFGSARILSPTRSLPTGTHAINRFFHASHAERTSSQNARFAAGEPVLVTRNDYDLGLFNGDQGAIVWVAEGKRRSRMAVFPREGGYRVVPLARLERLLEHAYAITVHKSQGSEFDHVAVVLPEEESPLLTRELLYTAVTRARRSVAMVGARERLEVAIRARIERHSGLAEKMRPRQQSPAT
jgi:exodeoxyribonuclease V alpha subunit